MRKRAKSIATTTSASASATSSRAALHSVTLISRVECHLCEVAEAALRDLREELGFALEKLDVDADPGLRAEYADRVPVILIDGREHGYWRLEEKRFRAALERGPVRGPHRPEKAL